MVVESNFRRTIPAWSERKAMEAAAMPFQITRIEIDTRNSVIARQPTQPLFELEQDALALAEFDATRLGEDSGFDAATNGFWARLSDGLEVRFIVEEVDLQAA